MKQLLTISFSITFSLFLFIESVNAQLPALVEQKIQNLEILERNILNLKDLDLRLKKTMLFKIRKSKRALEKNKSRDLKTLQVIEKKININNNKIIKTVLKTKKERLIKKYKKVGNLIQKFKSEGKSTTKLKALQQKMKIALDTL